MKSQRTQRLPLSMVVAGAAVCVNSVWGAQPVNPAARAAFERFADVAVELPPEIRTADLSAYSTNRLDFALNNGLAITRGGRLWVNWISGGDGPSSFTAGNWSDDGGRTWTDVNLVIDGHDGTIAGRIVSSSGQLNILAAKAMSSAFNKTCARSKKP